MYVLGIYKWLLYILGWFDKMYCGGEDVKYFGFWKIDVSFCDCNSGE